MMLMQHLALQPSACISGPFLTPFHHESARSGRSQQARARTASKAISYQFV